MNKKMNAALCALVCAAAVICMPSCKGNEYSGRQITYYKFNTQANLVVFDDFSNQERSDSLDALNEDVKDFLDALESSLSVSVETSCIHAFNAAAAGETVEIDKTAYEVLTLAKSVYELTDGNYNPAVYYCVDLYGFAPDSVLTDYPRLSEDSRLPSQEYVEAFRSLSAHFAEVEIEEANGVYTAYKPADAYVTVNGERYDLKIDLGGIGKGYAADKIDALTEEYGFRYGYFSFGSSSMSVNERYFEGEGATYDLQLIDPRPTVYNAVYGRTTAKNVMLSTSGDYENYFEENGVRYCHIIDPATGSPVRSGIACCTIIGGTAAQDDALTTAVMAMGRDKAVEFINSKLSDRIVIFCYDNGDGTLDVITNRPQEFTILSENYRLANTVDSNGKIILG